MRSPDFAVVGGGIVGLCVARELKRRYRDCRVCLFEREPRCGLHASGRNSGVLHAGFYYSADSLKARFCRRGNEALTEYCLARGLPINRCGKLVVARGAADLAQFPLLLERASKNGVPLTEVSAMEARRLEPNVKTCERALFSPSTSAVDPAAVCAALAADAAAEGVEVRCGEAVRGPGGAAGELVTSAGRISAGYAINCAGARALGLAHAFGVGAEWRVLPFEGRYLVGSAAAAPHRVHVYPVPDLEMPFLGVHTTIDVHGQLRLGPTALPVCWLERRAERPVMSLSVLLSVALTGMRLLLRGGRSYRRLALRELRLAHRRQLLAAAGELVDGLSLAAFAAWGTSGIRAQLVARRGTALEMDFIVRGSGRALHVLNAVSPGFTSAMPCAEHVVDQIDTLGR
ncbi:MAG: FAD-dependent oxidoreductase [Candidatus Schekmanbacteria bacterium]|nr:FAD-dependent oxidoreductase [Candidatus Schekmanbacteria bacterium]